MRNRLVEYSNHNSDNKNKAQTPLKRRLKYLCNNYNLIVLHK